MGNGDGNPCDGDVELFRRRETPEWLHWCAEFLGTEVCLLKCFAEKQTRANNLSGKCFMVGFVVQTAGM